MIAIALIFGLKIEQADVSTAFLYGKLLEANFMRFPPGFVERGPNGEELVCRLIHSIYGLHQSARAWYKCLKDYLVENGFKVCLSDPCVLVKVDPETKEVIIVLIYVNDLLLMCNSSKMMAELKEVFKKRFEIKDLGPAQFILGIQLERFEEAIWLGQPLYAREILEEMDMWNKVESLPNGKESEIPMETRPTPMSVSWIHDDSSPLLDLNEKKRYTSVVMKLSYLATQSRPDISFSVNILATHLQSPNKSDWNALIRVLRYVRGTYDLGILFQRSSSGLIMVTNEANSLSDPEYMPQAFADASYAEEVGRKSRSGYLMMMCGGIVTWYSKKQSTVAQSSTEAEYYSLSEVVKEALWMRSLLAELNILISKPITVHQDNQSTMAIAMNPINHQRVKHMDVRVHFLRHHLEHKHIELVYCPTENMIADILTKALPPQSHRHLCGLMGLRSLADLQNESAWNATDGYHIGKQLSNK